MADSWWAYSSICDRNDRDAWYLYCYCWRQTMYRLVFCSYKMVYKSIEMNNNIFNTFLRQLTRLSSQTAVGTRSIIFHMSSRGRLSKAEKVSTSRSITEVAIAWKVWKENDKNGVVNELPFRARWVFFVARPFFTVHGVRLFERRHWHRFSKNNDDNVLLWLFEAR